MLPRCPKSNRYIHYYCAGETPEYCFFLILLYYYVMNEFGFGLELGQPLAVEPPMLVLARAGFGPFRLARTPDYAYADVPELEMPAINFADVAILEGRISEETLQNVGRIGLLEDRIRSGPAD